MLKYKAALGFFLAMSLVAASVASAAASTPSQVITGTPSPSPSATANPCDTTSGGTPTAGTPVPGGGGSNPVANALCTYFVTKNVFGSDGTPATLHDQGFGFGEIAMACFIAQQLGGSATCGSVLMAKQQGDFSTLGLPAGSSVKNWGGLIKLALHGKHGNNLGAVMGHAGGKGNGKGNSNGKGPDGP